MLFVEVTGSKTTFNTMVIEQNQSLQVQIRRGSYGSLDIYDVTKDELEILKQGSPNSIFLNFAIALLSIFISTGSTLLTLKIESDRVYYVFFIIMLISLIAGSVTMVLWWKGENVFKKTIKKIEARMEIKDFKIDDNSITPIG